MDFNIKVNTKFEMGDEVYIRISRHNYAQLGYQLSEGMKNGYTVKGVVEAFHISAICADKSFCKSLNEDGTFVPDISYTVKVLSSDGDKFETFKRSENQIFENLEFYSENEKQKILDRIEALNAEIEKLKAKL